MAVENIGQSFKMTRSPKRNIENISLRIKVYLEGLDVTERYSAITGLNYKVNSPSTMTLTLECPDDDFLINEDDLDKINTLRYSSHEGDVEKKYIDFGNDYKNFYMNRFIYAEIPDALKEYVFKNYPGYKIFWLYQYALNSHIIPLAANVRVFIEFNGVWYWLFTGAVISRSFTQTIGDRKYVTYQCMDSLYFLRRASIVHQSVGIEDAKVIEDVLNILNTQGATLDDSSETTGGKNIQSAGTSFDKFAFSGEGFINSLVFAVFGSVDITQSGDSIYGENQAKHNLVMMDRSNSLINSATIYRNLFGAGLFNIENMRIGVAGPKRDELLYEIVNEGWLNEYLISMEDVNVWEDLTDNIVKQDDLWDLSALSEEDTDKFVNDVFGTRLDFLSEEEVQEEIIKIIGVNTRFDGIYSSSAGSLKILFPGGLSGTAYDVFSPDWKQEPTFDRFKNSTRLDVLKIFLNLMTDFFLFTSPKGDIIIEFPMYDKDYFGNPNEFGDPWRSFTKADWQGSYSDNINEDGLYSVSRATPMYGDPNTKYEGVTLIENNPYATQGFLSPTLLSKLGLKIVESSPIDQYPALNSDAARRKAELILSRANREAYGGSISLRFQPRMLLNRNIELWEVGRAGIVTSVNITLVKDTTPSYSINIGYVREWDGFSYHSNGLRRYDIAYGEFIRNLGIDYSKFYEVGN